MRELTQRQEEALEAWKELHGEAWKAKLRIAWMKASAPPALHALRNSHGEAWLAKA